MKSHRFNNELPLLKQKILKAKELSVVSNAVDLLETAKVNIQKKNQEIEEERERQRKAGFQEGSDTAHRQLLLHHWKTIIGTVAYLESMQEEMAKAIVQSVRILIQTAPPPERALQLATAAVERLRQQAWVVLCLHPEDVDPVSSLLEQWRSHLPQSMRVEVRASEDVHRGDCVLESPIGRVDASLETQLRIIQEQMQNVL